jgi:hypothetical protein
MVVDSDFLGQWQVEQYPLPTRSIVIPMVLNISLPIVLLDLTKTVIVL